MTTSSSHECPHHSHLTHSIRCWHQQSSAADSWVWLAASSGTRSSAWHHPACSRPPGTSFCPSWNRYWTGQSCSQPPAWPANMVKGEGQDLGSKVKEAINWLAGGWRLFWCWIDSNDWKATCGAERNANIIECVVVSRERILQWFRIRVNYLN